MSAEAVVALVSVVAVLQVAVAGFMWRNLSNQISALKSDLEKQIAALKSDLEKQIGAVRTDFGTVKTSPDREQHQDTENRLTARIDGQTERIDALHRDLRGLGERIARVEAGQDAEQAVATGSYPP